jgi:hypothetical protein
MFDFVTGVMMIAATSISCCPRLRVIGAYSAASSSPSPAPLYRAFKAASSCH